MTLGPRSDDCSYMHSTPPGWAEMPPVPSRAFDECVEIPRFCRGATHAHRRLARMVYGGATTFTVTLNVRPVSFTSTPSMCVPPARRLTIVIVAVFTASRARPPMRACARVCVCERTLNTAKLLFAFGPIINDTRRENERHADPIFNRGYTHTRAHTRARLIPRLRGTPAEIPVNQSRRCAYICIYIYLAAR